jgi:nucleotide-binding universal stress UspA family protein
MYHKILVPLDGSTFAEHALPLALGLARRSRASIHLVTVAALPVVSNFDGISFVPTASEEAVMRDAWAYLESTQARLRERIVEITGEVMFGDTAPNLRNLAATGCYDLVVMATHARSRFGRFFLGSVADEMVRHATLPLLLVHPEEDEVHLDKEPDLSRVIVPLDGTEVAEQILEPAVALTALIPGAEIELVRALPATEQDEADVADSLSFRDAREYLAAIAAKLEARGLRVWTHTVFTDRPAEAILNEADARHAGLIAMETHGLGGLARLLHGSIADKVVRGAHVPVLVHRPLR